MLFNSYQFIFVFLPITLVGFFLLGLRSRNWSLGWIVIASLAFYAWWRPFNVLLILPSIFINFVFARWLLRLTEDKSRAGLARLVLAIGIVLNVAFLGYFKYINFLATTANDLIGTNFVLTQVILPLGISFITFQKIAFLIDVHSRQITSFTLREFGLFVLFFPQLIAGPIVHYREMMPQFHQTPCRWNSEDIAVGLCLFVFGLFKKVVLADGIAEHVSPIYAMASAGSEVSLIPAWIAAVGFTLQIYFDFSGYSDMALGLARFFGVRLPVNFDSPLKATNIIDFWQRWHITLTRFLTGYIYNPLALMLTRWRIARGLPGVGGKKPSVAAFLQLVALPMLFTMFVSGLWHGAGYLFVMWGLLHGVYLSINHAWRLFTQKLWSNKETYERVMRPVGFVVTFLCVAVAMILFRSNDVGAANELLQGIVGLNGVGLPPAIYTRLGPLTDLTQSFVFQSGAISATELVLAMIWVFVSFAIAVALPNSLQLTARYEPALGVWSEPTSPISRLRTLQWAPTIPWSIAMSALVIAVIMRLGGKSEFLYWQF